MLALFGVELPQRQADGVVVGRRLQGLLEEAALGCRRVRDQPLHVQLERGERRRRLPSAGRRRSPTSALRPARRAETGRRTRRAPPCPATDGRCPVARLCVVTISSSRFDLDSADDNGGGADGLPTLIVEARLRVAATGQLQALERGDALVASDHLESAASSASDTSEARPSRSQSDAGVGRPGSRTAGRRQHQRRGSWADAAHRRRRRAGRSASAIPAITRRSHRSPGRRCTGPAQGQPEPTPGLRVAHLDHPIHTA